MKKLLGILVLGLLFCNNAFSKDIKLNCVSEDEEHKVYVTFNKKKIQVLGFSGSNQLEFKVAVYNDIIVKSLGRGLEKGKTSYDGYISNWNAWDNEKYKEHLYQVIIERVGGIFAIGRSKKPWDGTGTYDFEIIPGKIFICTKLEKKF